MPAHDVLRARQLLWRATGDRGHLDEAKRVLDRLLENAPPDCRQAMIANVPLHRYVAMATGDGGALPDAADLSPTIEIPLPAADRPPAR